MKKICIMNQPEGLGDILYTQKIGYHFSSLGYDIYWPTNSAYSSTINDYLPSFKYFNNSLDGFLSVGLSEKIYNLFLDYTGHRGEIFDGQVDELSLKIVPTNHLQDIQALDPSVMPVSPLSFMSRKYAFVGVSDHDWFDYLYISRNLKKELDLYHEVLKISKDEPYALVSQTFGTLGMTTFMPTILEHYLKSESGKSGMRYVDLTFIDGFTLFDWSMVIENAKEIWTEGSAITWLSEKLNLKADTLNLHCRHGFHNTELFYKFRNNWYSYDFTGRQDRKKIPNIGDDS